MGFTIEISGKYLAILLGHAKYQYHKSGSHHMQSFSPFYDSSVTPSLSMAVESGGFEFQAPSLSELLQ